MRNEIYLDEKLKGLGHCATKIYESDLLYVSRGGTNSYSHELGRHPNYPLMLFCFKGFDITLISGQEHISGFLDLKPVEADDFAMRLLLANMTSEIFTDMLKDSYSRGVREGRELLQEQLQQLLGVRR